MTGAIESLLRAVRRRQRLAHAAELLTRVALPLGLSLAAIAVAAARMSNTSMSWAWLAVAVLPGVFLWAQLRPLTLRAMARRVDEVHDLHDVIGNALELRDKPPHDDPRQARIVQLLVADAAAHAKAIDPRTVVPIRLHGPRRLDAVAALVLAAAVFIPAPKLTDPSSEPSPTPPDSPTAAVERKGFDLTMVEPVRQDLRTLAGREDPAAETAAALLELLDALEAGTLDRRQALERLEALEQLLAAAEDYFEAGLEEDPTMLAEAMWKLAQAFEQEPITQPIATALERNQGDAAEQALDQAGAEADASRAAQDALDRALGRSERQLEAAAKARSATADAMAEAERQLRRERQQKARDPAEQERRLKQMERRLQELRRQHEREKATQRRLEQLRREAQQSRKGSQSQRSAARNRLGQGLRRSSDTVRSARRLDRARESLEEVKTFVRRAGDEGKSQERRRGQMRRFMQAAESKGKDGKKGQGKSTLLVEGEVDGGQMQLSDDPGQNPGQSNDNDGAPEGDGGAQEQAFVADGMGSGSDETMLDAPESPDAKTKDIKVDATRGTGVSRAEVIRTSSQEGFASEPYRRVYEDYRSFAQSSLDSESIPAAQRRQVQRYFTLIQPRE